MDENKKLFDITLGDLKEMVVEALMERDARQMAENAQKRYVYGIAGIAQLFGCCNTTANKIKQSGAINDAISQQGGIIVVDAEKALDLLKVSKKFQRVAFKKRK